MNRNSDETDGRGREAKEEKGEILNSQQKTGKGKDGKGDGEREENEGMGKILGRKDNLEKRKEKK